MKKIFLSQKGTSLILSILTLLTVSILAGAVYNITRMMIKESVFQERKAKAQGIAEAGLEDALLQLRLNSSWRTGFTNKSFTGGSYTVTLSTGSPLVITSVGSSKTINLFGPARAMVSAQVALTGGTTAQQCPNLSSNSKAFIQAVVDAYDSSITTSPVTFGLGGTICSNDKVEVQSNKGYYVNGDVYYGKGPAPDSSAVRGTIYASTYTTRSVPSHDGSAYVNANNNLPGITPAGYYNAGSKQLTIPAGITVTMVPGNYYLNSLTINSGGTLFISNSTGTVTLYLNGDFSLNGTLTNASGFPSKMLIYPQGSNNVNLQANSGAFYGVVEGQNASIFTSQVVYGKLSGSSLNITANFHYDQQTGGIGAATTHAAWAIGTWSSN